MSAESDQRAKVINWLRILNAVSVENPVGPGTPDVNYGGILDGVRVEGWLELKSVDKWPVREETSLRLPHYSPQQRVWHARRHRVGGMVHVLLKVADDWILLDGVTAAKELGKCNKQRLIAVSCAYWASAPGEDLVTCLRNISADVKNYTFGENERN